MPAIPKGSLVLVSGISGFIASHLGLTLLENGYSVRGTVRSTEKGDFVKKLYEGKGKDGATFEYVIVEDIQEESGFDEAVKGVAGIAHTASPFYTDAPTWKELVDPALKGTTGILKAALAHNPDLKRIVVTSSVASVMDPTPSGPAKDHPIKGSDPQAFTFTEEDWNEHSPREVKEKGDDAPGGDKYRASKVLAEKAAWDFVKENKPAWDLATINPPLVFGPIIHQVDSPEKINTSVAALWAFLDGKKKDEDLKTSAGNWVDVRDVAQAHFLALTVEKASGERFITSSGPFAGQDVADILHSIKGHDLKQVPVGKPGTGKEANAKANFFDGSKAEKVLGLKYTPLEKTIQDTAKSLVDRFGDELKK